MISRLVLFSLFYFILSTPISIAQDVHAFYIKEIYTTTLSKGKSYDWLYHLSEGIGGRLAGSQNAETAVNYTYGLMKSLEMDTVWKQPCMVPG